jgi:hypothetical protein
LIGQILPQQFRKCLKLNNGRLLTATVSVQNGNCKPMYAHTNLVSLMIDWWNKKY